MSESALLAGIAGVIVYKGHARSVAVRTIDMEGAFSVFAYTNAASALERLEGKVQPKTLLFMQQHFAIVGAAEFEWGCQGCHNARYTPSGVQEMLFYQLSKCDRSVTRELVAAMYADPKTRDLMQKHAYGTLDPNPPPPESGEQPPPS